MATDSPRILLIDSYDSFTYNLASLCRRSIPGCTIHIIRNDQISVSELVSILPSFSAVVIGPGPGSPDKDGDIGIVKHIWKLAEDQLLPVFGVCLGLQSLAIEFGATLHRLNVVKHGQISKINHTQAELFQGVGSVEAVRYHSLHVVLKEGDDLECLAWADDGHENGKVVMAVKHVSKPFWAVQYHPESARTHGGGEEVVRNFWTLATRWLCSRGRVVQDWSFQFEVVVGKAWPHVDPVTRPLGDSNLQTRAVDTRVVESPVVTVTADLCESLGVLDEKTDFVLLDSAAQPSRFSIVGCLSSSSPKITYRVGDHRVRVEANGVYAWEDLQSHDVWTWLATFMRSRRAQGGVPHIPFWGGFIGYLSYELGAHALSPSLPVTPTEQPDVNLVFVERSVVLDWEQNMAYVQSLLPDDESWLSDTASLLQKPAAAPSSTSAQPSPPPPMSFTLPDKDTYISNIKQAKEYLFSGDSYELCVTAPTRIAVQQPAVVGGVSTSWELFKTLRHRNPAPHSGYIRLHPSTLLSSSPERFLSFSRPPVPLCQLRPMKGTVRKGPGVTRAVAEEALSGNPKEVAENLMIVDLIRHDLHGVLGEDVVVKQFCGVEENQTVWSMVSVIEGQPSAQLQHDDCHGLGWEVLRSSLPPGSMTGAPKKRSVELLHGLEGQPRSVYSGVFGYWDVGGGGDWSVVIRSCFKYDAGSASATETEGTTAAASERPTGPTGTVEWTLGAGGAITALSDPDAEWDEMLAKVESVLRAFQGVA
ncbi:Protein phosphatase PP2A regulatory subunit B [Steccherinum ochraceum]|uniref:aminodeoxychorismate synthase n=1 Tax=Steccherinum ochraceum TaxID=92696 RepID=A0A4R0RFK2_9APHY|nr:Protein phosphatase PP2A regulatory subunit B [Steccherinum ochraceum]